MSEQLLENLLVEIPCQEHMAGSIPAYATPFAAGADLKAAITSSYTIEPGTSALIPTGIALAIPQGYEVQIRPRSGLALKNCITVLNSPGTIDADYRGEIKVILINHGKMPFVVEPGARIAQMVLAKVYQVEFAIVSTLDETKRGAGGFGHTGTN